MPRRDFHDLIEKLFLGKVTGMSEMMDKPHEKLHGQHRVLFHDPVQVAVLSTLKGGDFHENMSAGILHLLLDKFVSGGKAAVRRHNKRRRKT